MHIIYTAVILLSTILFAVTSTSAFNIRKPDIDSTAHDFTLKSIEDDKPINEIFVEEETRKYAKLALDRMLAL